MKRRASTPKHLPVSGFIRSRSTIRCGHPMAVERARLSMQLAAQLRTKSVEAIQDIFHTQV